jgi:hypothetical protein
MLKYLVVAVVALIGDPTYLLRVWVSMLLGPGLVAMGYWFALPRVLPIWPAIVVLVIAALVGILWERQASDRSGTLKSESKSSQAFGLIGWPNKDRLRRTPASNVHIAI